MKRKLKLRRLKNKEALKQKMLKSFKRWGWYSLVIEVNPYCNQIMFLYPEHLKQNLLVLTGVK